VPSQSSATASCCTLTVQRRRTCPPARKTTAAVILCTTALKGGGQPKNTGQQTAIEVYACSCCPARSGHPSRLGRQGRLKRTGGHGGTLSTDKRGGGGGGGPQLNHALPVKARGQRRADVRTPPPFGRGSGGCGERGGRNRKGSGDVARNLGHAAVPPRLDAPPQAAAMSFATRRTCGVIGCGWQSGSRESVGAAKRGSGTTTIASSKRKLVSRSHTSSIPALRRRRWQ